MNVSTFSNSTETRANIRARVRILRDVIAAIGSAPGEESDADAELIEEAAFEVTTAWVAHRGMQSIERAPAAGESADELHELIDAMDALIEAMDSGDEDEIDEALEGCKRVRAGGAL